MDAVDGAGNGGPRCREISITRVDSNARRASNRQEVKGIPAVSTAQ
jgi:hypothetical protein